MICNRKKLKEENKMLQQVMTNPGEIIFREVPVPEVGDDQVLVKICLLYTSPSPRDRG